MQGSTPPFVKTVSIDYTVLEDGALVALVRTGNHEAFRHVVQRFRQYLYRIARGVVNDDGEAEDIVQEAFMRAYRRFDTFRGDAPLRTWLISILLNEARSRLRKRHVMVGLEQVNASSLDPYWASRSRPRGTANVSCCACWTSGLGGSICRNWAWTTRRSRRWMC